MTIEEKAKAYDEAIERARYWEKNPTVWSSDDICQKLFPELKESEDERIRKELIKETKGCEVRLFETVTNDEFVAWLEKQGEKKPTNKVEPKFHEGEWVVSNRYTSKPFCITKICDTYYLVDNDSFILFEQESDWRLWTIQDAKDGDVLVDICEDFANPLIFILKKFEHKDFGLAKLSDYSSYCFLTMSDNQKFKEGFFHHMHNIHPATKEQRDLLFQKMHDASYEWDAEKKELKKVEQKPNPCDGCINRKGCINCENGELREVEQKHAEWSEEDEYKYNTILHHLDLRKEKYKKECNQEEQDRYQGLYNWLKSLKDRLTWKPSDEQMDALLVKIPIESSCNKVDNILKSLYSDLKKLK